MRRIWIGAFSFGSFWFFLCLVALPQTAFPQGSFKADFETLLYALDKERVSLPDGFSGGAIAQLASGLLIASRDGRIAYSAPGQPHVLMAKPVPMNRSEFASEPLRVSNRIKDSHFALMDIAVRPLASGRYELFASHHYYATTCVEIRVSRLEFSLEGSGVREHGDWESVYTLDPCIPFLKDGQPFPGHQSGGRMLFDGPAHILLSTGDIKRDGRGGRPNLPMDPVSHLGKLLRITIKTGEAEVVASGFRNPQGLAWGPGQTVWATEHGPFGGDELNLIVPGGNYGWPVVTYGVNYGSRPWPLSPRQGAHDGFVEPVFAWIPSIGIGALVHLERNPQFPLWDGDFLIGSLRAGSLYRVGLAGDRIVAIEKIDVRNRVRDVAIMADGSIALLTDTGRAFRLKRSKASCDPEAPEIYQMGCAEALSSEVAGFPEHDVAIEWSEERSRSEKGEALRELLAGTALPESISSRTSSRLYLSTEGDVRLLDEDSDSEPGHQKSARWLLEFDEPTSFLFAEFSFMTPEETAESSALEIFMKTDEGTKRCYVHFAADGLVAKRVPGMQCLFFEIVDEEEGAGWKLVVASSTGDVEMNAVEIVLIPARGKSARGELRLNQIALGFGFPTSEEEANVLAGREAFQQKCATCHTFSSTLPSVGPALRALSSRDVASLAGFQYSTALKNVGGAWRLSTLSQFLQATADFAPGSSMPQVDLTPEQANQIAQYLLWR